MDSNFEPTNASTECSGLSAEGLRGPQQQKITTVMPVKKLLSLAVVLLAILASVLVSVDWARLKTGAVLSRRPGKKSSAASTPTLWPIQKR